MAEEQTTGIAIGGNFHFRVSFHNNATAYFQQCRIDNDQGESTEYRHGNSPVFYPIKMPGLGRVGNVVLNRGFFLNNDGSGKIIRQIESGSKEEHTVLIEMIDGKGGTTVTWTLNNAWPTKIVTMGDESNGGEIVVERIEISFRQISSFSPKDL